MLPVEHGKTQQYRPLSDDALKVVRDMMHNVTLVIIDEVSIFSNVTLLYIHLCLTEIFQTEETEDGWFGRRNLLLLGDLLQLPPVFEGPVYTALTADLMQECTGCVGTVDLWCQLITYDALTINIRQKDELEFVNMLSRIRLGHVTTDDLKILTERKLSLHDHTVSGRMQQVVKLLADLPPDTVCLLPTRHMCDELNKEMFKKLSGEEIHLLATDTADCPQYLRSKVSKKLAKYNDDSTHTAGLEKRLIIKVGCKIMLRRNIDVTTGLVNGAIGRVCSVKYSLDQANVVDSIVIQFGDGKKQELGKVKSKFQILDKAFIIRHQFPIDSAYAITIHKSQGLTLSNVVIDIGNTVFTRGQSYVALSRVTKLSSLYLINLDPHSIKALDSAIVEYTYLRRKFRPMLPSLIQSKKKPSGVPDRQWCVTKQSAMIQQKSLRAANFITVLPNKGFINTDGVSSYASSILQCMLCMKDVRTVILAEEASETVKQFIKAYESTDHTPLDCAGI